MNDYDEARRGALATFTLPDLLGPFAELYREDIKVNKLVADLGALPFPCVEIIQRQYEWVDRDGYPTTVEADAVHKGMMTARVVVSKTDEDTFTATERYTLSSGRTVTTRDINSGKVKMRTVLSSSGKTRVVGNDEMKSANVVPSSVIELLYRMERVRSHRYVEQTLSRQVRRAEGFAPEYRSYIVIETPKRKDRPDGGLTLGELMRRHPKLHAVRAHLVQEHLRTLRNGEIAVIAAHARRAHARGRGGALQVKDYIVK